MGCLNKTYLFLYEMHCDWNHSSTWIMVKILDMSWFQEMQCVMMISFNLILTIICFKTHVKCTKTSTNLHIIFVGFSRGVIKLERRPWILEERNESGICFRQCRTASARTPWVPSDTGSWQRGNTTVYIEEGYTIENGR